jgi:hypothetical protein
MQSVALQPARVLAAGRGQLLRGIARSIPTDTLNCMCAVCIPLLFAYTPQHAKSSGRFPNHITGKHAETCSNYLPLEFELLGVQAPRRA